MRRLTKAFLRRSPDIHNLFLARRNYFHFFERFAVELRSELPSRAGVGIFSSIACR